MDPANHSPDNRSHQLGRIIAVLPALQRKGTADRTTETLDHLGTELQKMAGVDLPHRTFDSLASQVLKDWGTGSSVETALPGPPLATPQT